MTAPHISISPATEEDASALASIMTAAFAASDAAYPLIWGSAAEGTHEMVAVKGLFSPVQRDGRRSFKAVDEVTGRVAGFVTWGMPVGGGNGNGNGEKEERKGEKEEGEKEQGEKEKEKGKKGAGLPSIPGVNTELWGEKVGGTRAFSDRDVDVGRDLVLLFFFVHPEFQRRGIGSLLLKWGMEKGDEVKTKIWLASTPQARLVYERNGWRVVERCEVDLGKFGGEGIYVRFWMVRDSSA